MLNCRIAALSNYQITHPWYTHLVRNVMGENLEQTKINIKVNPEYPWTIIIIGGETGRQMVQTMQITSGGVRPSMFTSTTYSCARARTERLFQVLRQLRLRPRSLRWWRVPCYTAATARDQPKHCSILTSAAITITYPSSLRAGVVTTSYRTKPVRHGSTCNPPRPQTQTHSHQFCHSVVKTSHYYHPTRK